MKNATSFILGILAASLLVSVQAQPVKLPITNVAGPTTSAQFLSIITDPTGNGAAMFGGAPLSALGGSSASSVLRGLLSDEVGTGAAMFQGADPLSASHTAPGTTLTLSSTGINGDVRIGNNAGSNTIMTVTSSGATAVNGLTVIGVASGVTAGPSIDATGSDTDLDIRIRPKGFGLLRFGTASSVVANGTVATVMTNLGPTGANTTIQEWLVVKNPAGTPRYIPMY